MSEQVGGAKLFQQVDHAELFYNSLTVRSHMTRFMFAGLSVLACSSPVDQVERRTRGASAAGSFSAVVVTASFASSGGAARATVDPRLGSTFVQGGRPAVGRDEGSPERQARPIRCR
jgi:hypothetical protein